MIYLLISFFIQKADYIPLSHLEDFFIDEHDGFVETFGKIGYLPNLASRTTLKFFGINENQIPANLIEKNRIISTNETNKPYSALTRLFSLLNEIRYVVGNHPNYQYFDSFIYSFGYPSGFLLCQRAASMHIRSISYSACQPRTVAAFSGFA